MINNQLLSLLHSQLVISPSFLTFKEKLVRLVFFPVPTNIQTHTLTNGNKIFNTNTTNNTNIPQNSSIQASSNTSRTSISNNNSNTNSQTQNKNLTTARNLKQNVLNPAKQNKSATSSAFNSYHSKNGSHSNSNITSNAASATSIHSSQSAHSALNINSVSSSSHVSVTSALSAGSTNHQTSSNHNLASILESTYNQILEYLFSIVKSDHNFLIVIDIRGTSWTNHGKLVVKSLVNLDEKRVSYCYVLAEDKLLNRLKSSLPKFSKNSSSTMKTEK